MCECACEREGGGVFVVAAVSMCLCVSVCGKVGICSACVSVWRGGCGGCLHVFV